MKPKRTGLPREAAVQTHPCNNDLPREATTRTHPGSTGLPYQAAAQTEPGQTSGRSAARSRRGSTSVFLCIVLASLIMLCLAMITGAREHSVSSRADAVLQLAGDSLLGEFDRRVLDDYGLFLLKGDGPYLTARFTSYASATLDSMEDVRLSAVSVSPDRYLISDPEPVRAQILAYMKSGGADLILKDLTSAGKAAAGASEGPNASGTGDAGAGGSGNEGATGSGNGDAGATDGAESEGAPGSTGGSGSPDGTGYRTLRHGPTIASLPSRQLPEKSLLAVLGKTDRLKDLTSVFREGSGRFLMGSYVLGTFRNCRDDGPGDHFFHNEAEYILHGELSDEENGKKTAASLRRLRFPSNLAFIMSDPARRDAAAAAGEAIAPGPVGSAIGAAIITAWAWAESCNDAALLQNGYRVPAVKDDATWALDVDTAVSQMVKSALDPAAYQTGEDGSTAAEKDPGEDPGSLLRSTGRMIRPQEDRGLTYEQYLRILLFLSDEDLTVMRILDLIQINMRKDADRSFLISEHCTGLVLEAEVNGRRFCYEKIY